MGWEDRNGYATRRRKLLSDIGGSLVQENSSWSVLVYLKNGKNGDTDSVEEVGSGSPFV